MKRFDISLARIMSMAMIVLCHIIHYYTIIPGCQFAGQIFNVGVQVFLIISGYLYGNKNVTFSKAWIISRMQRIWVPSVLVLFFYCLFTKAILNWIPSWNSIITYILNLQGLQFVAEKCFTIFFSDIVGIQSLWFITIILICYCLIPICQYARNILAGSKNRRLYYLSILIFLYGIVFLLQIFTGVALHYFVTFFNGYILEELRSEKSEKKFDYLHLWGCLVIFTQLGRVLLKMNMIGGNLYVTYVAFDHIILGLFIFKLFLWVGKNFPTMCIKIGQKKVIEMLDKYSIYIYMVHGIFCTGYFNVFERFNLLGATCMFVLLTIVSAKVLCILTEYVNRVFNLA